MTEKHFKIPLMLIIAQTFRTFLRSSGCFRSKLCIVSERRKKIEKCDLFMKNQLKQSKTKTTAWRHFRQLERERERHCIILAILLKNDDRDVNDADSQKVFVCEIRSLLRRVGLFIQVACICSGRTTKYNNKKENNCKGLILVALFDNKMAMSMPGGSILLQYRAFF